MSNEARDLDIARQYNQGRSLRAIAFGAELSHERVRQILLARGVALRSSKARVDDGAVRSLNQLGAQSCTSQPKS